MLDSLYAHYNMRIKRFFSAHVYTYTFPTTQTRALQYVVYTLASIYKRKPRTGRLTIIGLIPYFNVQSCLGCSEQALPCCAIVKPYNSRDVALLIIASSFFFFAAHVIKEAGKRKTYRQSFGQFCTALKSV